MTAKLSPLARSERIAFVANSAEAIAGPRSGLTFDIVRHGHRVLCITPPAAGKHLRALKELGTQHRALELEPKGLRLLNDWRVMSALVEIFKDWQPNVVMGFGLNAMVSAAIAARRAGVRRVVSLCNGLPNDGVEGIGRRRFLQAMKASDAIIFHNQDNRRYLADQGLLPPGVPVEVVPGAGVDLRHFKAAPLPSLEAGLVFLMLARLERSRGVMDYAAAAARLKSEAPGARFLLAGPPGRGADAITPETLKSFGTAVELLDAQDDVRPALAGCHVFVYPSHVEGMPPAVLEALATGRPVITSDTPGCRETVDEKVSGCLVPAGDSEALAQAMRSFLKRPDIIPALSRAARLKAERRFDSTDVNRTVESVLGLA
jgi:glycosyltransferase involved in cell wall biosynthesis